MHVILLCTHIHVNIYKSFPILSLMSVYTKYAEPYAPHPPPKQKKNQQHYFKSFKRELKYLSVFNNYILLGDYILKHYNLRFGIT